jgi:hypothetical protein
MFDNVIWCQYHVWLLLQVKSRQSRKGYRIKAALAGVF